MADTLNHVPELAASVDCSNTRTALVAVPSWSGLSLRYTAPPATTTINDPTHHRVDERSNVRLLSTHNEMHESTQVALDAI